MQRKGPAAYLGPMEATRIPDWSRGELRLAFYDFTIRGEGEAPAVCAVIKEWRRLEALSEAESCLWLDAVEWRESGHALPGWLALEVGTPSERAALAETATWNHFEAWRLEMAQRSDAA